MGARAAALLLALFVPALLATATPEHAAVDVRGVWVDNQESDRQKVGVLIEDCDGLLCGRIYWLKKPLYRGQPKRDRHNPDAALRDRPLCGLRILTGFQRAEDGTWNDGEVYNPNDGRTFSSTLHLENDGSLQIRGYIGISLFGKTVEWVRPQENLERCS